jgi:hypothetical protein
MFRMTRIVPTTVLTIATMALAAPIAQARPFITPSSGHDQANRIVVTTGDTPRANPMQLPGNSGLRHVRTEVLNGALTPSSNSDVAIDTSPTRVNVPDSSENGFDWTAAAIGAALGGILMLILTAAVGSRRHPKVAA